MFEWLINVLKLTREMRLKALDALEALNDKNNDKADTIKEYLVKDYQALREIWPKDQEIPSNLGRHIHFGELGDYKDILRHDLHTVELAAEEYAKTNLNTPKGSSFQHLLDPVIIESSYQQFLNGHLRDAVLNAFIAVFDLIRDRTGLDIDGDRLVGAVFSVENPKLILSELNTLSGRNDQTGFMQIFQGAYKGIRNPKAHTIRHDLTEEAAAQYLMFASLLARRVTEAKTPNEK